MSPQWRLVGFTGALLRGPERQEQLQGSGSGLWRYWAPLPSFDYYPLSPPPLLDYSVSLSLLTSLTTVPLSLLSLFLSQQPLNTSNNRQEIMQEDTHTDTETPDPPPHTHTHTHPHTHPHTPGVMYPHVYCFVFCVWP